jgi:hypothetical protein
MDVDPEKIARSIIKGTVAGTLTWRVVMTGFTILFATRMLWSMGYLPLFGGLGYARADDLVELRAQVTDIRISQLANQIDRVSTTLCMHFSPDVFDYRLELQKQHRAITKSPANPKGYDHESPSCEVLLQLVK